MDARVLIFREDGFPFVDTSEINQQKLVEALPPMESVKFAGVADMKKLLNRESVDLFINPYGSAFPKDAWPEIYDFLAAGGNFLNLGGAPFSIPVRREGDGWRQEIRQTQYHQELMINQAFPVETAGVKKYDTITTEPLLSGLIEDFACSKVFELQVRLTSKDDHPNELGTSGTRDAILRPLLYGEDKEGKRLVAPVIAIDRVFGPFAGGRWVLANFTSDEALRKEILFRLGGFAAMGPSELQVRPSFACYYPDERTSLIIHASQPEKAPREVDLYLTIRKESITIASQNIEIKDFQSPYYMDIPIEIPLSPGLYIVEARLSTGDPGLSDKFASYHTTGFWCYDTAMVSRTQPLLAGKDFFTRTDKQVPVVGTTYMASDVHRKFLFEPNAAVWNRDLAEISAAGVNILRTGIWTAFRKTMLDPGAPDEGVIRAFMAFMLTAVKYELPVIFTFFSFTPEMWEGENPYLDPRAIKAQKEFIAAFTRRFSNFNNLMWDLINEPVFQSSGRRWCCRPNFDEFEKREWEQWLQKRPDREEAWRTTPRNADELPATSDFDDRQIFENSHPMRALDFRLFSQEIFNRWVREMSEVIRQNGNPKQLITVGQEEGGAFERPNPQFHWKDMDFTCMHTWWLNDDLLWDGLVSKTPEKPNVIEETGIMFAENPDRTYRRTEKDCRNLLERKFVMGFASGAAGVIQWIWNTNVYMTSDNEVAIGFNRADLTIKPELEVLLPMATFWREARQYLTKRGEPRSSGRKPENVCMVIPHSNMFSVRNHASAATRACVRVMHYHCGMPMRAVGEYTLENLGNCRLIVLPSPRTLSQQAWDKLIKAVEAGAVLLVTGPIDWDEYWRPVERLGNQSTIAPVTREEDVIVFGTSYRLSFGGDKINRIDKAVVGGQSGFVKAEAKGDGKLIFTPLPFELADNVEPVAALYQYALKQAGIEPPFRVDKADPGILIRPQFFEETVLYSIVSETDANKEFSLTDSFSQKTLSIKLPAQRALMFLLGKDAKVLAQYGDGIREV